MPFIWSPILTSNGPNRWNSIDRYRNRMHRSRANLRKTKQLYHFCDLYATPCLFVATVFVSRVVLICNETNGKNQTQRSYQYKNQNQVQFYSFHVKVTDKASTVLYFEKNKKKKERMSGMRCQPVNYYNVRLQNIVLSQRSLYTLNAGNNKKSNANNKTILETKIESDVFIAIDHRRWCFCWWIFKVFALLLTSLLPSSAPPPPFCALYSRPFLFISPSSFDSSFDKLLP